MSGLMSGGDPICAMELLPIEGDIPIPIPAVVDMFELLLTPSSESEKKNNNETILNLSLKI